MAVRFKLVRSGTTSATATQSSASCGTGGQFVMHTSDTSSRAGTSASPLTPAKVGLTLKAGELGAITRHLMAEVNKRAREGASSLASAGSLPKIGRIDIGSADSSASSSAFSFGSSIGVSAASHPATVPPGIAAITDSLLKLRSYYGDNVTDERSSVDSVLETNACTGRNFVDIVEQVQMVSGPLADVITLEQPIHLGGMAGKNIRMVYGELQKCGTNLKQLALRNTAAHLKLSS